MKLQLVLLFAALGVVFCAPSSQLITDLPGVPGGMQALNFSMYAGYVNINSEHNTNYFYWFVESQRDPTNVSRESITILTSEKLTKIFIGSGITLA